MLGQRWGIVLLAEKPWSNDNEPSVMLGNCGGERTGGGADNASSVTAPVIGSALGKPYCNNCDGKKKLYLFLF